MPRKSSDRLPDQERRDLIDEDDKIVLRPSENAQSVEVWTVPTDQYDDDLDVLRFRVRAAERMAGIYAATGAAIERTYSQELLSKRNSRSASGPRPGGRHPRRAEALALALDLHSRRPDLSVSAIGTQVAAKMTDDNIPSHDVIARWLRIELKRRQKD